MLITDSSSFCPISKFFIHVFTTSGFTREVGGCMLGSRLCSRHYPNCCQLMLKSSGGWTLALENNRGSGVCVEHYEEQYKTTETTDCNIGKAFRTLTVLTSSILGFRFVFISKIQSSSSEHIVERHDTIMSRECVCSAEIMLYSINSGSSGRIKHSSTSADQSSGYLDSRWSPCGE